MGALTFMGNIENISAVSQVYSVPRYLPWVKSIRCCVNIYFYSTIAISHLNHHIPIRIIVEEIG